MEDSVDKFKRPMIYIVDASIDITGAFICARNEAKILRDEVDVVIVLPKTTNIADEYLVDFKKVIRLPIVNIRKSLISLTIYFPALIIASWRLRQSMKHDGCAHLQINDFYMMHGVIACLFGFRGRVVTWVRIDPRRFGSYLSQIWLKLGYRYSNNIVAVSNFIKETLPDSQKTILIYDPVYLRETSVQEHKSTPMDNTRKLIYIGNYIEGKGQQYAIAAFTQVAVEHSNVQLHFYGGDMGLGKNRIFRKNLEKQANATSYADRIYFHSFVNDIGSVLENAYAALNFSESESFSLSCLEASYHGLPVVATRSGGPEEIIEHNETGFLVKNGDIEAMSNSIDKLLNDENLAKKMGDKGTLYVKQKFSEVFFKNSIDEVFKIGLIS